MSLLLYKFSRLVLAYVNYVSAPCMHTDYSSFLGLQIFHKPMHPHCSKLISRSCKSPNSMENHSARKYSSESQQAHDSPFFDIDFALPLYRGGSLKENSSPWTDERFNLSISSPIQPNPNQCISWADKLLCKGQMLPHQVPPQVDTVRKLEVDDGKGPQQCGNVNGMKTQFPTLLKTASKLKIPLSGLKNSAKIGTNLQAEYGSVMDSSVQKQNKFFTVRFKVVEVPLFFRLTRDNSRGSRRDESSTHFQKKSEGPDGNIAQCKSNERNKIKVKEIVLKYVKMIKPLYVKISQRHNEKTRHADLEKSGVCIGTRNNGFSGSDRSIHNQLSFSGNLRTAHKHFFKERNSSSYGNPALADYSESTMMEFQSAIQGAIAHCKQSNYTDDVSTSSDPECSS